ncbi:cyanate hydratase [Kwoniella pini CBS 10737]|uniref:Cyanate hydratase n=1 Tax=Kwoniella pini CBS 10737 TaxID=1296096 RepID=A0A1B9HWP6_9TREE|nr:cyanate hydratase [Kwoniella pini CBS 10737]OCF47679.1 cyanate hydratase [Kwoniella pini CBS 10737]
MMNLPEHNKVLLLAKSLSGLTFEEISKKLDKPEVWTAALFYGQAICQDKETAENLFKVLNSNNNNNDFLEEYNNNYILNNLPKLTKEKFINSLQGIGSEGSLGVKGMVDRDKGMEMPPKDPVLYRLYEVLLVYGYSYKAIIAEKFGDGIMSAIDFRTSVERKKDPKGDRVVITMDGKFLSYSSTEAWKG